MCRATRRNQRLPKETPSRQAPAARVGLHQTLATSREIIHPTRWCGTRPRNRRAPRKRPIDPHGGAPEARTRPPHPESQGHAQPRVPSLSQSWARRSPAAPESQRACDLSAARTRSLSEALPPRQIARREARAHRGDAVVAAPPFCSCRWLAPRAAGPRWWLAPSPRARAAACRAGSASESSRAPTARTHRPRGPRRRDRTGAGPRSTRRSRSSTLSPSASGRAPPAQTLEPPRGTVPRRRLPPCSSPLDSPHLAESSSSVSWAARETSGRLIPCCCAAGSATSTGATTR